MSEDQPIACSLEAGELRQRLAEIEALGAEGLIEHSRAGERHLLRFSADEETKRRLEEIVSAESKCCGFLDIGLEQQGQDLLLTLAAPEGGQIVAEGLAVTFARARS